MLGPTHCTGASLQRWCKAWCKVAAGPVGPTYMYMYVVPAPHVGLNHPSPQGWPILSHLERFLFTGIYSV